MYGYISLYIYIERDTYEYIYIYIYIYIHTYVLYRYLLSISCTALLLCYVILYYIIAYPTIILHGMTILTILHAYMVTIV